MARTALECEEMISACDEAGWACSWPITVAPCRALSRSKNCWTVAGSVSFRSVSIRNEQPAPGRLRLTTSGWRLDPEISGGGHFVDLGSHILDLLDWLLGPVTYAAGIATNRGGTLPSRRPGHRCLQLSLRRGRCRCLELRLVPAQRSD